MKIIVCLLLSILFFSEFSNSANLVFNVGCGSGCTCPTCYTLTQTAPITGSPTANLNIQCNLGDVITFNFPVALPRHPFEIIDPAGQPFPSIPNYATTFPYSSAGRVNFTCDSILQTQGPATYFCSFHPSMKGTITATSAPVGSSPTPSPTSAPVAPALTGYDSCILLSAPINYKIRWRLDRASSFIYIALQADVDGWVAFGLSPRGTMNGGGELFYPGSDIAMGFLGSTCPNGCVNDYYSYIYNTPILDKTQNIEFLSGSKVGKTLTIEYRRKLVTSDSQDWPINPDIPTTVIWAANEVDIPTSTSAFAKHSHVPFQGFEITFNNTYSCPNGDERYAVVDLNISPGAWNQPQYINNLSTMTGASKSQFYVTNVEEVDTSNFCPECLKIKYSMIHFQVPSELTSYMCQGFAFPADKKRHVVKIGVHRDNKQVLHHIVLYSVTSPVSSKPFECGSMPRGSHPMWGWAPGTSDFYFPPQVGLEVGVDTLYMIMQVHYDNPAQISGLIDRSGVNFYMTDVIRQYDSGFIFLGVGNNRISIPPGVKNYHLSGTCGSSATSQLSATPLKKITVFATAEHMHYLGRQQWVNITRSGTSTKVSGDLAFDFNAQKFSPNSFDILPGDIIDSHCVWDSTAKTTTTKGGEDTFLEMCLPVFMYYPKIASISRCQQTSTSGNQCSFPNC